GARGDRVRGLAPGLPRARAPRRALRRRVRERVAVPRPRRAPAARARRAARHAGARWRHVLLQPARPRPGGLVGRALRLLLRRRPLARAVPRRRLRRARLLLPARRPPPRRAAVARDDLAQAREPVASPPARLATGRIAQQRELP